MSIYIPHIFNAVNNRARSFDTHTLHIIGIHPRRNVPAILDIYIPLYYYCNVYVDSILVHT